VLRDGGWSDLEAELQKLAMDARRATRSFQLAGSIVGTEMFTKMMLYYFHERLWAAIPWH
jgi:hypothetical protein